MTKIRDGFLVRRLNQIWSALLHQEFRKAGYDVTNVQFAAMEIIAKREGLDQTDLALRLGYDRATTGSIISRLERADYITRKADPDDRRARILFATPKGRSVVTILAEIALKTDEALLAPLSQNTRDTIFAGVMTLVEEGNKLDVAPPFRNTGRPTLDITRNPHIFSGD